MILKGIDDIGNASIEAPWQNASSPLVATDPKITVNNLSTLI